MTAIATDPLKSLYSKLLFDQVTSTADTNHFYIGIGKSDQYDSADDTVITPVNHLKDERDVRYNLESIIKVAEASMSFVIPRSNWTSGTPYEGWNDAQSGYASNKYYVMTEDQQVYICLAPSRSNDGAINVSTVKPSFAAAGVPLQRAFKTSDGYIWKFAYEISASRAAAFLSSQFMPVEQVDSDVSNTTGQNDQNLVKNTCKKGQILGIQIVDAGEGYSSTPTLSITGNGTGAAATITRYGTAIGKIDMDCVLGDSGMGQGYDYARVTLTGGGSPSRPAVLRPIIGPRDGIGFDATRDLKSSSLMFNAKPSGTQAGFFSITDEDGQSDFRQISLIKNLHYEDSAAAGNPIEVPQARVSRQVQLTTNPNIVKDEKITAPSGTKAWVDFLDSAGAASSPWGKLRVHYHFNTRADLAPGVFLPGELVTGATSAQAGTVDSDRQPKYSESFGAIDKYSGEILYIDNRSKIIRSSTQTEDIKIILTV